MHTQKTSISRGSWPTMLTPFTDEGAIDYEALSSMIDWYIAGGVNGLFAVCQSSEMFYLSLDERVALAQFVVEQAAGRVPVIASGHVSERIEDQIEEINRIAATGIDAFVLVSNRLATADEGDAIWQRNAERILEACPHVNFGIYECPYPYKRLMSPNLLKWCADSGRFLFLKDTCCDIDQLRDKLQAVAGTALQIFNANTATLLASLQLGAAGFSGVMANFHPALYTVLLKGWQDNEDEAERLQSFLTITSFIEMKAYPINAKYYMRLCGLPVGLASRSRAAEDLTVLQQEELRQLQILTEMMHQRFVEGA